MVAQNVRRVGSIRMLAGASPSGSRQFLQPLSICRVWIDARRRRPSFHQLVDVLGQDRPDCVNGVVPAKTLAAEPSESVYNDRIGQRQLVLDDYMKRGVQPRARQPNAGVSMVRPDELNSQPLVCTQPIASIGSLVRIVRLQVLPLLLLSVRLTNSRLNSITQYLNDGCSVACRPAQFNLFESATAIGTWR